MRLLSRIFGGFVLFAVFVFGGVSSSFADMSCKEGMTYYPEVGDCCYAFDGKSCISDFDEWVGIVESLDCKAGSGAYVNSDGNIVCCPEEITQPNELYQCECYDERFEFNPKTGGCDQCKYGMTWYPDVPEEGACCYFFDDKNNIECLTELDQWINFAKDSLDCGEKGAYVDINNEPHCCPEGTIANEYYGCSCENPAMTFNNETGICGCPAGYFWDGGTCLVCPEGYTCIGDLYEPKPNVYAITLRNYNDTGTHQTIYEKYNTGWYSNSAATTQITKANIPTRSGYKFRGYYTSTQADLTANGGNGTRVITNATSNNLPVNTTFTANTNLYAAWAKDCTQPANGSCTLTINSNGTATYTASCNSGYALSGDGTATPTCTATTANCYRIDLDNTTNGGTGGAPTSVYMYRDATTYSASQNQSKWCKLYTDSACTTEVAYSGSYYTLPTTNPTKSHATFYNYVGSNGSLHYFYRSHINSEISYPQAWDSCIDPDEYYGINSIGFNASQTPSLTLTAKYDCDEGWRGSCTISNVYNGYKCFSNTACTVSPTSTISFNANGGSGGRSGTVTATYGSMLPVITTSNWTTPHRFEYRFTGYSDAQSGGNFYYGSTGASGTVWDKTANTTLYAQWNLFMDNNSGNKLYFYDGNTYKYQILCSRSSCTLPTYSTAGITKPTGATWLGWAFLCGNYEYCGAGDATDTGLYGTGSSNGATSVANNNNFFGRYNEDELDSSFATGLHACWEFSVNYNLNGATDQIALMYTNYNNCQGMTLPIPTRDNYIFAGWYDNSSFSGSPVTTIAAGSTGTKTYYAKWTESPCWHTALDNTTYGGTGGTTDIYINKSTCNVYANAGCTGSAITALPSTPTKANAWYSGHYIPSSTWGALISPSGSDRFTNLKTECNSNRFYSTLVAKYGCDDGYHAASSATNAACVANSYSVHFNSNCPTTASGTMSNQSFTYGTAQNLTNNGFSCTGYTFAGWATSASGAKVYNNQESVSDLTTTNGGTFELYAKWSAGTYGISYVLNGGLNVDLATYTPVEYLSSKSANSAFSYFDTGTKFDFGKDFRVVGKFSNPNTSARHILLGSYYNGDNIFNIELKTSPTGAFRTYFASGADGNTSQAIAANTWTAYDVFYDPFSRKSKTIAGTQNFTLSVPNGTGEVTKDMRMFLDYRSSPSAVAYPVKMAATAIYKNNALVNYYVPVRNSSNVCGMYDAKNNVFKASATAAAFDCPSVNTMPTSFTYDTGATISGVPVRAHSKFAGWCTNSALTQGCAMTKTIAANSTNASQTFYAKWTCDSGYHASGNACVANTISLSWTTAHGTAPSSPSSCSYGGTFTAPAAITDAPGYDFQGWNINGTLIAAGETVSCNELGVGAISGNVSNSAVWSPASYTITLNDSTNGGTGGSGSIKEVFDTEWQDSSGRITSVALPTKAASGHDFYVFTGYSTAASGGTIKIHGDGVLPEPTIFTANTTLYAQFGKCACTTGDNVTSCTATGVSRNQCEYSYSCASGFNSGGNTSGTFTGDIGVANNTSPDCSGKVSYTMILKNHAGSACSVTEQKYYYVPIDNKWYSDSALTNEVTHTSSDPTCPGYTFRGWYWGNPTGFNDNYTSTAANRGQFVQENTSAANNNAPNTYQPYAKNSANLSGKTLSANNSTYARWARNCDSVEHGQCDLTVAADGYVTYGVTCDAGHSPDPSGGGVYNPSCPADICTAGQYLSNGVCTACTTGYYCADGVNRTECPIGLSTPDNSIAEYHDDAGDCGRILHIGTYEIRLKSVPSGTTIPSPAVRFDYDGDGTADFYARMSLVASPMRVTSSGQISSGTNEKNFKTRYNNSVYYVCDDGTCN